MRFNESSAWVQHLLGNPVSITVFVNLQRREYSSLIPEDGVYQVRIFESVSEWREGEFWTAKKPFERRSNLSEASTRLGL